MLGIINRAFECFVRDSYGRATWLRVAKAAALEVDHFEALMRYDPALCEDMICGAVQVLGRPRDSILEDLGTYLVSHENLERLRRLLRFGGVDFASFLNALEDLPARGRLALPELDLPDLVLQDQGDGRYHLQCQMQIAGIGHIVVGLLRAMADDYGVLALIDFGQTLPDGAETVVIQLLDHRHSSGKQFDLSVMAAG